MANHAIVSNKFLLHYFRLTFDLHFTVTLTNNIPRVQAFKTKCTWNILGGKQRKTKKPRSILLQEITSLIFSVTDSRKGATWEKEVKQRDLEHPTRWILPNSNWGTVDLIGVRLADKGKREQECLWGRCKHEVAPLNARGRIASNGQPWELAGQIEAPACERVCDWGVCV